MSRSYRKRPYTKSRRGKYGRTGKRKSFQKRVRRAVLNTAETKQLGVGSENIQLYHNTGVTGGTYISPIISNPWNAIQQGSGRQQRVGLQITPRGMSLRIWMANKLDRPNIIYRLSVLVMPKTYNNTRVTAGSIDPMIPIFAGSGNGNNLTLMYDREKGIKVLYDRIFSNEKGYSSVLAGGGGTNTGNKECHIFKKLWIGYKGTGRMTFESNANQDILNRPVWVFCIPYDSYGTLVTDNIASCACVYQLYWKDV